MKPAESEVQRLESWKLGRDVNALLDAIEEAAARAREAERQADCEAAALRMGQEVLPLSLAG